MSFKEGFVNGISCTEVSSAGVRSVQLESVVGTVTHAFAGFGIAKGILAIIKKSGKSIPTTLFAKISKRG